mmetsp:Transcript_9486/g.13128  ORF Transcript_9486/g.13128 Transcript_9486/m.13128 type:complete len:529 (-) Transcript_9486:622-2208(-)
MLISILLIHYVLGQQSISRERWISSVLSRNDIRKGFIQETGLAWLTDTRASSVIFRGARSARSSNPELTLVLFVQNQAKEIRRSGVFDIVIELGSKERATLKVRALALAFRFFHQVILLDAHSIVCGSLMKLLPLNIDLAFEYREASVLACTNKTKIILNDWIQEIKHNKGVTSADALRFVLSQKNAAILKTQKLRTDFVCAERYCRKQCIITQHKDQLSAASTPNALSNFYLWKNNAKNDDHIYRKVPTVFLHIPKAGGNSAKKLFVKGILHRHRQQQLRSLHIQTRWEWDQILSPAEKKKVMVLYGAFSFGACTSHPLKPCAYYVIFRHPIARLLSEFKYCRSTINFRDQCCGGRIGIGRMRSEAITIVEWAQEKGNFMLEHLLGFSSADWKTESNSSQSWHERNPYTRITPLETRRIREGAANQADLDYVLEHLDSWFAVIGILEQYETSLALISFALTGSVMPSHQAASVHTHNQHSSSLQLDPDTQAKVEDALHLDLALYAKATDIFSQQVHDFQQRRGLSFI